MFKSKKDKLDKELKKEELGEIDNISAGNEEEPGEEELTGETEKEENEVQGSSLQEFQIQVSSLRDKLLRKAAEFENYKRRTENELSSFFKYANESLIIELLPVLDDFDRVFKSANDKNQKVGAEGDSETFKKGVELIYEKLTGILKKHGLKEMETDGKSFDFNLHDALLQVPDDKHAPNTILETAEKGYYLKDKVVRHAKVLVSSENSDDEGKAKNK